MQTGYQGSTHTPPKADTLVWRIADKAKELSLQTKIINREGVKHAKLTPDLRARGRQKFSSSVLATFNKKIANIIQGKVALAEVEKDDLPPPAFAERDRVFDNISID